MVWPTHYAFDDPIVFPGQPGRSHLHLFYGNPTVNAATTTESLLAAPQTAVHGGTANRSAYWVAALIDTRTGCPVAPKEAVFYYKTGGNNATTRTFPRGLRMIAGDASRSRPWPANAAERWAVTPWSFHCSGLAGSTSTSHVPNCPAGTDMYMSIVFPQCWDGVNLDSPDHRSHMAYGQYGECPASHPVKLPVISINAQWPVRAGDDTSRWRLSSDNYPWSGTNAGYSAHADWWNGWDESIMNSIVNNCLRRGVDCGSGPIGDGRVLQ